MANTITIDILADTRKLVQGVNATNEQLTGLNAQVSKLQGLGTAIAGIGVSLGYFSKFTGVLKTSLKQSIDTAESVDALKQIMGDNTLTQKFITDMGNVAQTMGLSKKDALLAAQGFSIWGKAAKLTGKELDGFVRSNLQRTVDVGSLFNKPIEQVQTAIQAAYRGQFEPISNFIDGLTMAEVKQEALRQKLIKTKNEALEPSARILVINKLLTDKLAIANNNFAITADSSANAQKRLNAELDNSKSSLGDVLNAVYNPIVNFINNNLIPAFKGLPVEVQAFIASFALLSALTPGILLLAAGIKALIPIIAALGLSFGWAALIILAISALVALGVLLWKNWDTVKEKAMELWEGIKSAFEPIANFVKGVFTAAWEGIKPWLQLVVGIAAIIIGAFVGPVIAAFNKVKDAISKALGSEAFDKFMAITKKVIGYVSKQWGEAIKLFVSIGGAIIKGIWTGISNAGSWLRDKFYKFFGDLIPGWVKKMLGIKSPSKVFIEFGQQIVKGLSIGMNPNGLRKASSGLASGAMSGFGPAKLSGGSYAGGGGVVININAGLGTDPYELGRVVQQALNKYESINGSR